MYDLPKSVNIVEVGPRDGLQIEPKILSVDERVTMIDDLLACGFHDIEVGSFVNPKAVPQMANTDKVLEKLGRRPDVAYRVVLLNPRGLKDALATGRADVYGQISITASETFVKRNTNRSIDQTFEEFPQWIELFRAAGIDVTMIALMAAFGCNFEGYVPLEKVIGLIDRASRILDDNGAKLKHVTLADTMGWANPLQVKRTISAVRERWPDIAIKLHLHDTRGAAMANAVAAMELGVAEFDSSVGGLGGCPFAGHKGAAGNICTEDLAYVCEEMDISTGIDLDRLREVSLRVEQLVGHPLPGKIIRGGTLAAYKSNQRSRADVLAPTL
ncbi:hydroxymethylglutaryl-CoA lyase [Mesorhizobium sp. M0244]|uniref:hydroxymethylglutaryl-CoA lyase n=1 Tax=Mesorhizobium sp. M0244 TaxID=2956926 RepID=UPI00333849A2